MTKLEKMLEFASKNNHYYAEANRENGYTHPTEITHYPVITRKELQKNRYIMFSNGYMSKYYAQQLHRQSSSGSSGIPVNVYWDKCDWYASNMSLWRKRMKWYKILPSDKCVVFTLSAFEKTVDDEQIVYATDSPNILSVNMSLINTDSQYQNLVKLINQFDPVWMSIQPFVLNRIIYYSRQLGLSCPPSLKYIESVGEVLPSDLRRRALDYFDVPLANMYGSEEMNGIAIECPCGNMHILDDNVFVEVMNKGRLCQFGEGEAIITNLNNYAMPLVRYNQGDQIVINPMTTPCACGSNTSIITSIKGRTIESIKINSATEINTFLLSEIIAEVNNQFNDAINEYRFVFLPSDNVLRCYLDIDQKSQRWFNNVRDCLATVLKKKLSDTVLVEVLMSHAEDSYRNTKAIRVKVEGSI